MKRIVLVYDGDSGLGPMLLDVAKKAFGVEECPLCEITYSPIGHRSAWKSCRARLGIAVDELHRDQLPEGWGISRAALPVVVLEEEGVVRVILSREEIVACRGSVEALERNLLAGLQKSTP